MSDLKTRPTDASVSAFLDALSDETKRADSYALCRLMEEVAGAPPKMWGPAIIGFGDYHYKYESGRENDWFVMGFSPRKAALTIYQLTGAGAPEELYTRLGKHTRGKGCLYIKKLQDVDLSVLREILMISAVAAKTMTG